MPMQLYKWNKKYKKMNTLFIFISNAQNTRYSVMFYKHILYYVIHYNTLNDS